MSAALDLWFWAGVAVVAVALLALAAVNMGNGDDREGPQ